jgi:two-component system, NarL family, sensor kinase
MEDARCSRAETLLKLVDAREADVARTARVLHDEVSQVLSAIGLHLDVLRMDFEPSVPDLAAKTAEIQLLLENVIDQVRKLSRELNPSVVERAGLQFALNRLVGRCRESHQATVRLLYDSTVRVPQPVAEAMFRIAGYAVENALRYAPGTPIEIIVKPTKPGAVLEIRDQGRGFDVEQTRQNSGGIGLLLMEHHAALTGLELTVSSEPETGTIVRAFFKLPM